ncbi:MAG TPA: DEAD/DEAH box helicase, partial [Candidatus Acetothermia bacterium]|nr:DEAD/DEAH box helicase [Candidatus Acetothermia bacterium]
SSITTGKTSLPSRFSSIVCCGSLLMATDTIACIKGEAWYRNQIVHLETIPATDAIPADVALHPTMERYLRAREISLYRHQVAVIEAMRAGKDVIITTPTASGKTLAFNIPIFETFLKDENACALYIYPLKALANDQYDKLKDMEEGLGLDLHPSVYDGDTPTAKRSRIRNTARVILTNPHALHYYLPWHHQWSRFYANLRYIVIDEAHQYRGVFGANVALLLRRLYRILARYGSSPQIVLASASVANPQAFARDLTGRDVAVVSEATAARGERQVCFWDALLDNASAITTQAARILATLSQSNVQTLCFTRSRVMAEVVARRARDLGGKDVLSYRAGYLPRERREIEAGLRDGSIKGVVSTSALEAGIDIGSLDAVILVGFPGSLLSAWQQAGRAGRGTDPSLIVFMPQENPLDRYFMHHPDAFLGRERSQIVIRPDNPRIVASHMLCAAAELPLRDEELSAEEKPLLQSLVDGGLIAATPRGFIYRGVRRAHELVRMDSLVGEGVKLLHAGKLLETMDPIRARRDAYPGAVLLHRGETYVVENLDLENGVAQVRQEEVDYYTKGLRTSTSEIISQEETIERDGVTVATGRVRITESFIGYQTMHYNRAISVDPLDLPPYTYETDGLWIILPAVIQNVAPEALAGGLHGAEHALIAMAP